MCPVIVYNLAFTPGSAVYVDYHDKECPSIRIKTFPQKNSLKLMKWFSRESVIDRVIVKFMISFPYISGTLVYLCMFGFWRVGLVFIIFPFWEFLKFFGTQYI